MFRAKCMRLGGGASLDSIRSVAAQIDLLARRARVAHTAQTATVPPVAAVAVPTPLAADVAQLANPDQQAALAFFAIHSPLTAGSAPQSSVGSAQPPAAPAGDVYLPAVPVTEVNSITSAADVAAEVAPTSAAGTSLAAAARSAGYPSLDACAAAFRRQLDAGSGHARHNTAADGTQRRVLLGVFTAVSGSAPPAAQTHIHLFDPALLHVQQDPAAQLLDSGDDATTDPTPPGLVATLIYDHASMSILGDPWTICMPLAAALDGAARGVILPVVRSVAERRRLAPAVEALGTLLLANGVGFWAEVDTLAILGDDPKSAPTPRVAAVVLAAAPSAAAQLATAQDAWAAVSASCARLRPVFAPLHTVIHFAAPISRVFVISLYTFGGCTDHLVLFDPQCKSQRRASGSMAEVLHELLSIPAPSIIFVPTTRTDRPALLAVCSALQRKGKTATVVFPNEIVPLRSAAQQQKHAAATAAAVQQPKTLQAQLDDRKRTTASKDGEFAAAAAVAPNTLRVSPYDYLFENDAPKMWERLQQVEGLTSEELLFRVVVTSGKTNRRVLMLANQRLVTNVAASIGGEEALVATPAATSASDGAASAARKGAVVESDPLADPFAWMSYYFSNPARQQLERHEATALLANPLFISYIATEDTYYERPANPAAAGNFIVAAAFDDKGKHPVLPVGLMHRREALRLPSLDRVSVLVVYDAKAFLLLARENNDLMAYLAKGGKVWCVALAEYLLTSQRIRKPDNTLPLLASRYSHSIHTQDVLPNPRVQAALLNQHLTPLTAVRRALGTEVEAIQAIFRGQMQQAAQQSQVQSLALRMDALLAFFSMERHGIHIDQDEAKEHGRQIRNKCLTLETMLNTFIPPEIPIDMHRVFSWHDTTHVLAYYFGGPFHFSQQLQPAMAHDCTRALVPFVAWFGDLASAPNITEDLLAAFVGRFRLLVQRDAPVAGRAGTPAAGSVAPVAPTAVIGGPTSTGSLSLSELMSATRKIISRDDFFFKRQLVRIVCFDIESTGLNALRDQMVEVAMYDPFENSSFGTKVNPEMTIPREATQIHGISNAVAAAAPKRRDVALQLATFLRLTEATQVRGEMVVLLSHATFGLDQPLLLRLFREHCPEADTSQLLFADSLKLFRCIKDGLLTVESRVGASKMIAVKRKPTFSSKVEKQRYGAECRIRRSQSMKLEGIAEALKVPIPRKTLHSAMGDASILAQCVILAAGYTERGRATNPMAARQAVARLLGLAVSRSDRIFMGAATPKLDSRITGQLEAGGPLAVTPRQLQSYRKQNLSWRFLTTMVDRGCLAAPLLMHLRRLASLNDKLYLCDPQGKSLRVVHPDGVTRQSIELTSTITSRTTSINPSCQNIAKEDPTMVRRIFTSRFGDDGFCVEIDYSQLEIVIMANLCGDPVLAQEINSGKDFHCSRAAMYCGMTYKQLMAGKQSGDKKAVNFRKQAKIFTFQRLYGAGVDLIHKTTKLPKETIVRMIRDEERKYPRMKQFVDLVRASAARPGNPGLPTHLVFELPTGCRMGFRPLDVMRNMPPVKNYPIQGFGAEVAQLMLGRIGRHLLANNFYNQRCFLTNFVHDSLWLDVHKDCVAEATATVARMMAEVDQVLPALFPGLKICVPFAVTTAIGPNMHLQENKSDEVGLPGAAGDAAAVLPADPADADADEAGGEEEPDES